MSSKDATIEGAVSNTKRTAGFWTVLFMGKITFAIQRNVLSNCDAHITCTVMGVQFGGLTTVWSFGKFLFIANLSESVRLILFPKIWLQIGAAEGLKKLLLSHALIGFMYFMLACCVAELTSIVPFAGGSFGFCRVALGPFWGFMVGASEVLENIMKVVVCVFLIAISVTAVFETDPNLEPVWELVCYVLLYGIHLRGGALLWYSVIGLGLITVGTVLMFCIGNTKDIDIEMYGRIQASTFEGRGKEFIETFSLPIWVYIGLEIVPQTCERVKNVSETCCSCRSRLSL